jgi:hypothetical protein
MISCAVSGVHRCRSHGAPVSAYEWRLIRIRGSRPRVDLYPINHKKHDPVQIDAWGYVTKCHLIAYFMLPQPLIRKVKLLRSAFAKADVDNGLDEFLDARVFDGYLSTRFTVRELLDNSLRARHLLMN